MLAVESVSKSYGALRALDRVSLEFAPGEVHAVVGENGAGKSTLMGVLSGFVSPDEGRVTLDGRALPLGDPAQVKRFAIQMVHQHFMLVPTFTVAENLALARLEALGAPLDVPSLAKPALDLADELGWSLDPDALTRDLPVGVQQRVEILKALAGEAKVLILDEPTAVLSQAEVIDLMGVVRRLRDRGATVLLIAHKLSEVLGVADRVSVLRRGKWVGTVEAAGADARSLAEMMVGDLPNFSTPNLILSDDVGLRVRELVVDGDRGERAVDAVSFDLIRGQILGVGGVDGNGQVELAEALVGIRRAHSGTLEWAGASGEVAYVPQDRQQDGLALDMSIADNLLLTGLNRAGLLVGPLLRLPSIGRWARGLVERFDIKAQSERSPVASLSGGNQQKVVVGRALSAKPKLLVVVNPTRGLDIRATSYVHEKLLEEARAGAMVVLFSTDLDELASLSDRTLYMSRGRLEAGTLVGALAGGPT